MRVEMLLFAGLREAVGADRVAVELESPATVATAARRLFERHPEIARIPLRFAVEDEFVGDDHVLRNGDAVTVVHPVSGG